MTLCILKAKGMHQMKNINMDALQDKSFRFSSAKCREVSISLRAAEFLRWLYLEPGRPNEQIIGTFGMGLAWTMLRRGCVDNPLGEHGISHTNLWSLTSQGIETLEHLMGDHQ